MTTNIAKIRAALERAGEYIRSDLASERGAFEGYEGLSRIDEIKGDLAGNVQAIKALAELENAAAETVAWIIGKPTHCHEIGRYLAWNAGHVPHSVGSAAEPLYASPPAPVAEIREVVVTDESLKNIGRVIWISEQSWVTHAERGRTALAAVRAELGPALGLVELKEPTPEECERICTEYERLLMREGTCGGRDAFDAVRAVMWPKEGL